MCSLKLIVFCCHWSESCYDHSLIWSFFKYLNNLHHNWIKDHNLSCYITEEYIGPEWKSGVSRDDGGGLWFLIGRDYFTNEQKRLSYFHLTKQKRDRCTAVCTTSTIVPTALWVALKGSRWVAMATFQYGWPVPFPIAVIISVISGRPWGLRERYLMWNPWREG